MTGCTEQYAVVLGIHACFRNDVWKRRDGNTIREIQEGNMCALSFSLFSFLREWSSNSRCQRQTRDSEELKGQSSVKKGGFWLVCLLSSSVKSFPLSHLLQQNLSLFTVFFQQIFKLPTFHIYATASFSPFEFLQQFELRLHQVCQCLFKNKIHMYEHSQQCNRLTIVLENIPSPFTLNIFNFNFLYTKTIAFIKRLF